MNRPINLRLFAGLLVACTVVTLIALPYLVALTPPPAPPLGPPALFAAVIPTLIEFSIAIFVGLTLAPRVGFEIPVLEGKKPASYLKSVLPISISLGIAGAGLVILLSFLTFSLSLKLLKVEIAAPRWAAFLASFDGGIAEEVLCRLFVMTLLAWIASKIRSTEAGGPTAAAIWAAIVLSAALFGLGHLGSLGILVALTPEVALRTVLLNGVVGMIYGWLYWKKGLESAMVAHFSTDLVLHVITPWVAGLII